MDLDRKELFRIKQALVSMRNFRQDEGASQKELDELNMLIGRVVLNLQILSA